ncbi:transcriptional regulator with XRE-family HTH domain [Paenibacillus sp. PastF-3]|uniref:helix-turn-helix domain-containing protein n=1 Tax=unclassified Paenibacillus TaxID=185978 RepID=UPI000BA0E92B|nr:MULTISPECIES: helix-turn-helix transcriptional regulator [unclassified Paenibacillus]MDH6374443.1 transcriptional regulator with XRE-family HTH domain [Paenibacillus sp. PastF-3]OZQ94765.1 transcriptional regulator [Paenibacillus sp. VTT E-133291]
MKQMTIRAELADYLKKHGTTINQFAEVSKVNSGTISNIINGNRPIAMQQLDRITEGMGLEEGCYYDLYVDECFVHSNPNWRRLRPFLYRCAELDKLECIARVVGIMMDSLSYTPSLFDTAEDFFTLGKHKAAAMLYQSVAESEKYQHSERLALCQYRLFTIALGEDQDANLRAAVQFEGFVNRLDEVDQLAALKDLAYTYCALRHWDKVMAMAKEMGDKATIQYHAKYDRARKSRLQKEPEIPLFSYIQYSYLLRSVVYRELGDYDRALQYVNMYMDINWIREDTEEALQHMSQCMEWARAHIYLLQILKGDITVLPDYVAYMEQREEEILSGLIKILQAANYYQFNVDDILLRFEGKILDCRDHQLEIRSYNHQQIFIDRYTNLMAEIAFYYIRRNKYEISIKYIMEGLDYSVKVNNESCIIKCVGMFEELRHTVSLETQKEYQNLISKVQRINEKRNVFVVGSA